MVLLVRVGSIMLLAQLAILSYGAEESTPYDIQGELLLEALNNVKGGKQSGSVKNNTKYLADFSVSLAVDTEAVGWWSSGEWYVSVFAHYGGRPTELTGDLQAISNYEMENNAKILEFWYKHEFIQDHANILVGLHDYSSIFYSLDAASLFTHSSFSYGPEIYAVGAPVAPNTALATRLELIAGDKYLLLGVYDGIPGSPTNPKGTHIQLNGGDGLFKAVEIGMQKENGNKIALGAWQQTARVTNPVDGGTETSNNGMYIIGQMEIAENTYSFAQVGAANANANQLDRYYGAGVRHNNWWRDNDSVGVGVASARSGSPFLQANPALENRETAWLATYLTPLRDWVYIQTTAYYIEDPGADALLDDAAGIDLRLCFSF